MAFSIGSPKVNGHFLSAPEKFHHRPKPLKIRRTKTALESFEEKYTIEALLGEGGFGTVYSGVRLTDQTPIAVKCIAHANVRNWENLDGIRVPLEICLLQKLSNLPGVIRLLDWFQDRSHTLLVMERPTASKDLFDFITERVTLPEALARRLFTQIVGTIAQCHQAGVYHRDIKDENILVDLESMSVKLIDFGAGTYHQSEPFTEFSGTSHYAPPEWFTKQIYDGETAAIWSLGILLYVMVYGDVPFETDVQICQAVLPPFGGNAHRQVTPDCRDLICRCLAYIPEDRISLQAILRHPWMATEDTQSVTVELTSTSCTSYSSARISGKDGGGRTL